MTGFFLINEDSQRVEVSRGELLSGEQVIDLEVRDGQDRIAIKLTNVRDVEALSDKLRDFAWEMERKTKELQLAGNEPLHDEEFPETSVENPITN